MVAHLEKFSLHFSSLSFATIRANLLHVNLVPRAKEKAMFFMVSCYFFDVFLV